LRDYARQGAGALAIRAALGQIGGMKQANLNRRGVALALGGWVALLLALAPATAWVRQDITLFYLFAQDRWLLLAGGLGLLLAALAGWRGWSPAVMWPRWGVWALAGGLFGLCLAGHYLLLCGYSVSRDEQMVDFDAAIYATGHLAARLPEVWRGDVAVLNSLFLLPVARPVAWVSAYLPGNAALHAVLGAGAGPLWVAVSVLALWGVARRLLDREGAVVALVLFALSGQVVFAGMTVFAMPAHLAFNLAWLWLFLRDERRADVAALALGFVATGLHQPLFHPMFVAPWLALLLWERRWGRLGLFVPAYGLIGLFWLWWPHVTLGLVMGPGSSIADAGTDYLSRLIDTLRQNAGNGPLMAANVLRLAGWSHLALWPLAGLGLWAARGDRHMVALGVGLALPLVVMGLILPYQGHGFGYRYLHPQMGNAALLGAYGWSRLGALRDRLRGGLIVASLFSALVMMPMQGWFAHRLYAGFASVSAKIDAVDADYMIVGIMDAPLALDLVHNRPDLSNRPLRLSQNDIADVDALAARLCRHGETIALPRRSLYVPLAQIWHLYPGHAADKRYPEDAAVFGDAGCRVIPLE
jgi:hypothetical protein